MIERAHRTGVRPRSDIKFSVVGITETWLMDSPVGVEIDGYNFVYKNRSVKSGGGVGLYVSDNLDFRIRTDIYADEAEVMEALFIEIIRPHEKISLLICYIMGVFNLNLLKKSKPQRHRGIPRWPVFSPVFSVNHVTFPNYFSHCNSD
ncbi:unnamed protein product [Pocillopora meandrina]|uniref:Uncharacterized protein n=1 Tax=Pocillopora meandrina TaxID=46732 RepID=A0AAU9W0T5_9CNID|nr:unnamed protein product [Pocillopora meandrina]